MSEEAAEAALRDLERAPVDPKIRAILRVIKKLTLEPATLSRADIDEARAAGVSDSELRDAMYVCFCFDVITRLADAFDYPLASRANQLRTARYLQIMGYSLASLPG